MALRLGSSTPSKLYLGGAEVTKAYLGASEVYSSAPAAWTPAELGAALALWLDADDAATITLNGSTVSQWNDKSGNGFHFAQATAANQPAYVTNQLNGKPVIRTDGNDILVGENRSLLRNVSQGWMVIVAKYPTVAGSTGNLGLMNVDNGATPSSVRMLLTAFPGNATNTLTVSGRRLDADPFTQASSSTTRASVQNTWMIEIGNLNYGAVQANHWTNGVQDLTAAAFLTAGNTSNTNSVQQAIFAVRPGAGAVPNDTEIAEAFILENDVSTENRQKLEGYLAWKWGLEANLPAGHPYKNAPPTV